MDKHTTHQTERKRLHDLTATLLSPETSGAQLQAATRELNALFDRLSPLIRKDLLEEQYAPTFLEQGIAASVNCAALCAEDPLRVSRFLQGIERAIGEAQTRFPSITIHLLYAGTGPYATLVTPLLTRHSPAGLQVTMLDIHRESLDSLRAILGALGLEAFVKAYLQTDASRYRHPKNDPIHIVVSETMTSGLMMEMQVPITLNLAPQLTENGLWIPESVRITAVAGRPEHLLVPIDRTAPPPYPQLVADRELGTLFRIGKDEGCALATMKGEDSLPAETIKIPIDLKPEHAILLHTEITIFGDIHLTGHDSTLNHLVPMPVGVSALPGHRTPLRYRLGTHPGLECTSPCAAPTVE
ncbi:hypothetical protein Thimo_3579 [Thioflavicoccus mobilis 8321]|uniref:Phytanoyl-CoA dioxygenase (PhyH) n=1 Tax=Thioflavicoccus mobilis 8321 TaxID=765912 RepID=L0H3I7_9GAMM|nr:hypothetical protein [Thioflavicoccus mobilis]AGA92235.1 hypothetical protein Thimo_3579 [Thioflavicoccus mobilis 8321]